MIREKLAALSSGYQLYSVRNQEFQFPPDQIPFKVASRPLEIDKTQNDTLKQLGNDITGYISAVIELYGRDSRLYNLLNRGKPEIFLSETYPRYLFYRPDLIITPEGFFISEIETSPFGLAIAHLLNQASIEEGFQTLTDVNSIKDTITKGIPHEGTIVWSNNTKSFQGQMLFLADKIFSTEDGEWQALSSENIKNEIINAIYRAFYLHEYLTDGTVNCLIDNVLSLKTDILPSLTPYMEEKAILALIWDSRWEKELRKMLGDAVFNNLRKYIPPGWILGEEKYFAPGLPENLETSIGLAGLSKSKRTFVLKSSGFSENSYWGKSVHFLHKKSGKQTRQLLYEASCDPNRLYVIQEFKQGKPIVMRTDENGSMTTALYRVRLTPYYDSSTGTLIGIKATGCQQTDYLHTSTSSVNAAVMEKGEIF